ncbi:MAG: hypothetical protein IH870_00590 [Chloroflexi bacterium]|nr:hypothetical protein [Chloroflexota bacterium]
MLDAVTGLPAPTVGAGSGEFVEEELVDTAAPPQAARASAKIIPTGSAATLLKPIRGRRAAGPDLEVNLEDTTGAISRSGENHRKIGAIY